MRTTILRAAAMCLFAASVLHAQEPPKPGAEHDRLKKLEGAWTSSGKMFFEPGKPPIESKGSVESKMELGGFWLISNHNIDMAGMPMKGKSIDGYDPGKKKYISIWVDSMGPAPMIFEGEMDAAGKVLTLHGDGPGFDGKPAKWKSVTETKDADHFTFTMSVVGPDGKDMKILEVEYTRKK